MIGWMFWIILFGGVVAIVVLDRRSGGTGQIEEVPRHSLDFRDLPTPTR